MKENNANTVTRSKHNLRMTTGTHFYSTLKLTKPNGPNPMAWQTKII